MDVTRWHFWNNKVTACRWQLSLVLSMSPLQLLRHSSHIAQLANDVERKTGKDLHPLPSSSSSSSLLCVSSYFFWPQKEDGAARAKE